MVNLSIREAVKHFNVSRPTLTKALKSGKLSGVQDGQGQWHIDPSELARVYQKRKENADKPVNNEQGNLPTVNTFLATEVEALRELLAQAEQRVAIAEALAEERKRILDETIRMIPPPPPLESQLDRSNRRRWWPF